VAKQKGCVLEDLQLYFGRQGLKTARFTMGCAERRGNVLQNPDSPTVVWDIVNCDQNAQVLSGEF
jgi:hypothetical protein